MANTKKGTPGKRGRKKGSTNKPKHIPRKGNNERQMKASRTRKANREALKEHATGERFEIELTPPPPFRPASEEVKKFHAKLEATLERVPHGAAFIIPAKTKNSALKYLRENHAKDTFRFFTIEDNKEFLRVYRVKKDKH